MAAMIQMENQSLNVMYARKMGTKVQIVGINISDTIHPISHKRIVDIRRTRKPTSQKKSDSPKQLFYTS